MTELRIDGRNNVPQTQQAQVSTVSGGGAEQPVDLKKAKGATTDEAFQASGLAITREDVKKAQGELGIRTSAKTKERVAQTHNDYAKQILAECGDNAQLRAIAMKYVPELPKASKGGNLQSYKAACDAKLEAFRAAARDAGLGNMLVQHEQNSQDRHVESEVAADNRQVEMQKTTVQVGEAVIGELGAAKEEIVQVAHDEGDKTRKQVVATGNNTVRRVNNNTNAQADRIIEANKAEHEATRTHVTSETDRAIAANAAEHETTRTHVTNETDRAIEANEAEHKATRTHVTNEANRVIKEENLNDQRQAVLDGLKTKISNVLMNEVNESFPGAGYYRDSTVKWIGTAVSKVMGDLDADFATKKAALEELTRMVDEEIVISDKDRKAFEDKYLRHPEKKKVEVEKPVDNRQIS